MTMAETAPGTSLRRSAGGTGCLAMWQCTHSSGSAAVKGRLPGQHFVQRDAQGIEVAARIDRPVHAPGLFGGHVGEGPGDELGRRRRLALAWQARRDAKARQPDLAGRPVDEHMGRLEILVEQAPPVELAERRCQADGQAQKWW